MSQLRYCDHSQRPNERRAGALCLGRAFVTGSSRRGRCEPVPTGGRSRVAGRAHPARWSPSAAVPSSAAHDRPPATRRLDGRPVRPCAAEHPSPGRSPTPADAAGRRTRGGRRGRPARRLPRRPAGRRVAAIGACVAVVLAARDRSRRRRRARSRRRRRRLPGRGAIGGRRRRGGATRPTIPRRALLTRPPRRPPAARASATPTSPTPATRLRRHPLRPRPHLGPGRAADGRRRHHHRHRDRRPRHPGRSTPSGSTSRTVTVDGAAATAQPSGERDLIVTPAEPVRARRRVHRRGHLRRLAADAGGRRLPRPRLDRRRRRGLRRLRAARRGHAVPRRTTTRATRPPTRSGSRCPEGLDVAANGLLSETIARRRRHHLGLRRP